MNLSSLSNADLDILFSAIESANSDAASEVYDAIMEETERRKAGKHDSRTGYRIEMFNGGSGKTSAHGKWQDVAKTYFGNFWQAGLNRFFTTPESAHKAVDRINAMIKAGDWEGWKSPINPANVRLVKITTTREIV